MGFLTKRWVGVFILGLILIFSWVYYQSYLLKSQGDSLLRFGKPEEAIQVYEKVQKNFPFRIDIGDDIEGARLIIESNKEYEKIVGFEEFQELPPINNIPEVVLLPNQLFVPILMYHHIRPAPLAPDAVSAALTVSPKHLEEQLIYLKSNGYQTITLDDLSNAFEGKLSLPEKPIILTFDDGYADFYDNAFPLLKRYNAKAVEFVITKVVDVLPAYLTWKEIKEMDDSQLIELAAHTRHHPNLPELSQKDIVDEIKGSKSDLEEHLKKTVNWFAYPYGSYSSFIMSAVRDAGFKGAASTVYGAVQSKENGFLAPRIMVDGRFTLDNLARRIQK